MRILCIGDSLPLPREGVPYDTTWFYKLQKSFPDHDFVSSFHRGMLIGDTVHYFDDNYRFYDADMYILQTGICDCSPRYFNDKSLLGKMLISIIRIFGMENMFWYLIKKTCKRNHNCVYTGKDEFAAKFSLLLNKLTVGGGKVVIVKIGKGAPSITNRSPFFNKNVDDYNAIIDCICGKKDNKNIVIINPLGSPEENMYVDGYHCNPTGMDVVYYALNDTLQKFFQSVTKNV